MANEHICFSGCRCGGKGTTERVPVLSPATPIQQALAREAQMFDVWVLESMLNRTPLTQKES